MALNASSGSSERPFLIHLKGRNFSVGGVGNRFPASAVFHQMLSSLPLGCNFAIANVKSKSPHLFNQRIVVLKMRRIVVVLGDEVTFSKVDCDMPPTGGDGKIFPPRHDLQH